ncbi:MAG: ABC transporter ATP-binding protein, partial [Candidatus Hermodarchaeota archaeon]
MNDSVKDRINWIVLAVSGLGLVFTIVGTSAGLMSLTSSILEQTNLVGVYLSVLFIAYALFSQATIPVVLFRRIINKGKIKISSSSKSIIIFLALTTLFFILLSGILVRAEETLPISGQLLFFSPIITLIAGLFAKDYRIIVRKKEKSRLIVLLDWRYISDIIYVILFVVIIPVFYLSNPSFEEFFISIIIVLYVRLLIEFFLRIMLVSIVISFFIINIISLSRSQLLENKAKLILTASILSSVASFFLPNSFLFAVIFTVVISSILKYISLKRIPIEKLRELTELEEDEDLLKVDDLKVYYIITKGAFKKQIGAVKAVDGISFKIKTGETLGLVGESGCGKTTVANCILGLVKKEDGEILFNDKPILTPYSPYLRQKIQIVFQDPDASLNPRMKVVDIVAEPLKNLMGMTKKEELRNAVLDLLEKVSLNVEHLDRYPHEFSGGQKQRIIIARALASNPELIILDEPTSALDVSVQAQILNLLKVLQKKYHYGFLFITHNLSVVNHIADRVAVMYLGRIVETGSVDQIFNNPSHPYTKALLKSRSEIDPYSQEIKFILEGEVPSPINPPSGCHFNPRCSSDN